MSDSKRIGKQLLYGGLYIVVIFSFLYGSYALFFPAEASCFDGRQNQQEEGVDCGGPFCQSCDIPFLQPIRVASSRVFFINGASALIELQNPNPTWGGDSLLYTVEAVNSLGDVLASGEEKTFLYPGERKYIIKNFPGIKSITRVNVEVGTPEWKSADEFARPNLVFRSVDRSVKEGKIIVSGTLQNRETLLFPRIVINALFHDENGELVSLSMTEIRDVRAFEDRFFQIEHPLHPAINPVRTELFFDAKRP